MTDNRRRLSPRPTTKEVAQQIDLLHDRIDEIRDMLPGLERQFVELTATVRNDRHDSKNRDQIITGRLDNLERSVGAMVQFFGISLKSQDEGSRQPKRIIGWERWQAMATVFAAAVSGAGVYKVIAAAAVAIHHALMAQH